MSTLTPEIIVGPLPDINLKPIFIFAAIGALATAILAAIGVVAMFVGIVEITKSLIGL